MNIALFGDPAFKLFVPGVPQTKPADVTLGADGRLVATGPEKWTKYKAARRFFLFVVFLCPFFAHFHIFLYHAVRTRSAQRPLNSIEISKC